MIWCEHRLQPPDLVDKTGYNPVDKPGIKNRAMFISPYLRRPIRPLNKVLSERERETIGLVSLAPANDVLGDGVASDPVVWDGSAKRAAGSK